jgi:hypothetical protein
MKRQGGQKPRRSESERQWLIAELLELRYEGRNIDRQEAIMLTLRSGWELGWPEPRRRVINAYRSEGS